MADALVRVQAERFECFGAGWGGVYGVLVWPGQVGHRPREALKHQQALHCRVDGPEGRVQRRARLFVVDVGVDVSVVVVVVVAFGSGGGW